MDGSQRRLADSDMKHTHALFIKYITLSRHPTLNLLIYSPFLFSYQIHVLINLHEKIKSWQIKYFSL